jgi:hypothetical protein
MRGATLTAGGTAEAIAWSIDHKIFAHARRLLKEWKAAHESKFGEGSWAAAGGPSPESIGLHRLSEQTLLLTDTCNAARAAKRLVAEAAMEAGKAQLGEAAWEAMSDTQRDDKCKVYVGQCHQHLRNIIVNAMQAAATQALTEELQDSLAEFSSFDRMSADVNDLIYAIWKALHAGGEYAKGWGKEFTAWLKVNHPSLFVPAFECAKGSRQDIVFIGAVPIYVNRTIILKFLKSVEELGSDNKLAKFLARTLSCNEITASLRVNTLWKYLFSEPARWLAGKGSELDDWSIESSSKVLDLIEKAMVSVAADGHTLLDPSFDPFESIADSQPKFRKWRDEMMARTVLAPDKTPHEIHKLALSEARSPQATAQPYCSRAN